MKIGEHPRDVEGKCPKCGVRGVQAYNGTAIYDGATVNAAPLEALREVHHYTCTVVACLTTYLTAGDLRPDLGADEFGWVMARRDPEPPSPLPARVEGWA